MLRVFTSFNKSVGIFLRSLGSCDIAVKWYMFNHLWTSFYGAQLWVKRWGNIALLKQLAISYPSAHKKVLGLPKWASNHFTCSMLGCLTFDHFLNLKVLKFNLWMKNSTSSCFALHKFYFWKFSSFYSHLDKLLQTKYSLNNFEDNDVDALIAMNYFVHDREPSSFNDVIGE